MLALQPQFTLTAEESSQNSATFVIEPLPQGYGHTLGNSLRRVLYTSIPGAAITSVNISGVNHQFTTVNGVSEDVVQIILALKQVRVAYLGDKPVQIELSAKGPGTATAADFKVPAEVKIANPDHVIANLSDKSAKLEITATVESGLGYSPSEDRKSSTVGVIPLDAAFTPVSRVNFTVDATRVGRLTNYDKLILEIITDGTVSPQNALKTASSTLVDFFAAVVNPTQPQLTSAHGPVTSSSKAGSTASSLSVEELDLPTRISNALQKAGLETVTQLLTVPRSELARVKNLGSKSVKIIEIALKERGLDLSS